MQSKKQQFIKKILSEQFPCIGAKASVSRNKYVFFEAKSICNLEETQTIYAALEKFVQERQLIDRRFATFIVCFTEEEVIDETGFEIQLWHQLKMLHELDSKPWDNSVSSDTNSPCFSYSIAGEAFFVLGMSPKSKRDCRYFNYPLMIFNSHHQFNYLKDIGLFTKIRNRIRSEEKKHSGEINPNLSDFGEQSEARQYSGRHAEEQWQCPVNFNSLEKDAINE